MSRIGAILTIAAATLSACSDGAQQRDVLAPLASIELGAAGTQVVTGETGPGAVYALYRPDPWNGRLVVWAHGYVSPALPIQLPPAVAPLRDALLARGFGFAYSSYAENGWALKDGVQRTRELRGLFASALGDPQRTYAMGQSLGGAVTLMLAETNPGLFDGALPLCAFVGGSPMEWDYIANVRVLFDYFFPGVIPGDVLHVPDGLDFERDVFPAISAAVQADPARAMEMAGVDQIEIQYASVSELIRALRVLLIQVTGAEDLEARVHGSFFDNTATHYTGSRDDAALNEGVGRFQSTPDAQEYLEHYYEPDGRLEIPVLTLHTTRDGFVPFTQEAVYAHTVAAQGSSDRLVQRAIDRFGHCTFTVDEQIAAVEDLVAWAETGVKPAP